jgi:hypothetical protein
MLTEESMLDVVVGLIRSTDAKVVVAKTDPAIKIVMYPFFILFFFVLTKLGIKICF